MRTLAARETGFTLIELLVATAAAIVVILGLSSVLVVTLHQTQRTFSQVDATRQARTTFQTIENELHSACVNSNVAPVQATSTATTLKFLSFTGDAVNPIPQWHELALSGTSLIDATYGVTGPTNGVYGRGAQVGSGVTLVANASQLSGAPVFQYFAYQPFAGGDGSYYWAIPDGSNPQPVTGASLAAAPLSTGANGLSTGDAADAVEVQISLNVGASATSLTKANIAGTTTPVTDSISLRLTTPPSTSGTDGTDYADYGPCQ